jgi:hypothetical protein
MSGLKNKGKENHQLAHSRHDAQTVIEAEARMIGLPTYL